MKKAIVIIAILLLLFWLHGFAMGRGVLLQDNKELPITPNHAIALLEEAKTSHEYWAEHEDKAWWVSVQGQDAQWADRYARIIELIENIQK